MPRTAALIFSRTADRVIQIAVSKTKKPPFKKDGSPRIYAYVIISALPGQ